MLLWKSISSKLPAPYYFKENKHELMHCFLMHTLWWQRMSGPGSSNFKKSFIKYWIIQSDSDNLFLESGYMLGWKFYLLTTYFICLRSDFSSCLFLLADNKIPSLLYRPIQLFYISAYLSSSSPSTFSLLLRNIKITFSFVWSSVVQLLLILLF